MKLIIMRHGQASWSAPSDQERPLTDAGRAEVERTARKLKTHPIDRILASPYLRAQQTAEIVSGILGCPVETLDCITPDDSPKAAMDALPDSGNVLIASHMPLVSALTGLLCEGSYSSGPGFYTGNAAVLELDMPGPGMASLKEMVTP